MAPIRSEIQVVPVGTAWQVERDGKPFLSVQTKQVAVDEAVIQAQKAEWSHVIVRTDDGEIEEEATFGEGPAGQDAAGAGRRTRSDQSHAR